MLLDILSLVLFIVAAPVDTVSDDSSLKRFIVVYKENTAEGHRNRLVQKTSEFLNSRKFQQFDIPGLNGFTATLPQSLVDSLAVNIFKTNIRLMTMLISLKRTLSCPSIRT
jgi:hypothetical protein